MGFDLYFAGAQWLGLDDWIIKNKCCRLQSQLLDRSRIQYILDNNFEGKLFIDSGAYTAYTRNKQVDVDEYISYVNGIDSHLTIFAQVDKIPGQHGKEKTVEEIKEAPKLSWNNYLYMRERVISPDKLLPVFHRREDWKYLEQMLETTFNGRHIPYIGIAATTDSSTKEKQDWFKKVFHIIKKVLIQRLKHTHLE